MCLLIVSTSTSAETFDEWTCTELASKKTDNQVISCGVAVGETEGDAREKALIRAKREFELICESSAECAGRQTILMPLRNVCKELSNGKYKCVRGLRYTVLDKKKIEQTPAQPPAQREAAPLERPRAQPTIAANQRRNERRQLVISFGVYTLSINNTFADSSADSIVDPEADNLSGNSLFATVALGRRLAFKGGVYSLIHDDSDNIELSGYELLLLLGNNFDRIGGKLYFGGGYYAETWSGPSDELEFAGSQFNVGIGYNWSRISIDLIFGLRESSEYADVSSRMNSFAEMDSLAYSGLLELGIRF